MEVLFAILAWFLYQLLGEFLFAIVGAFLMAVLETFTPRFAVRVRTLGPHLGVYALAGFAVGLLSIAIVPGPAQMSRPARIASLALLPGLSGVAVAAVGGKETERWTGSSFLCGASFGLGYAACRLLFALARARGWGLDFPNPPSP